MSNDSLTFTFSTVSTTGDASVTEVALHSNVCGTVQQERVTPRDAAELADIEMLHIFFPTKILSGITKGTKAVDSAGTAYRVLYEETFDDHQEIYMRRVGL